MTSNATWLEALRASGRVTSQRLWALEVLAAAPEHLGVADLHVQLLAAHPSISLSTVYRTMTRLEQLGLVHRVETEQGTKYGIGHGHSHAVCSRCGEVNDLDLLTSQPLADAARAAGLDAGEGGVLMIQGICSACRAELDHTRA